MIGLGTKVDELNRVAVNMSSDGILLLNKTGQVVLVNPAISRVSGLPLEAYLHRSIMSLYESGHFSTIPFAYQALESRTVKTGIQDMSTGSHLAVTAIPVFDSLGSVDYVLTIARDIKQFHELLKDDMERLAQLNDQNFKQPKQLAKDWLTDSRVVVRSKAMCKVMEMALRVAPTNATVLLFGKSGVGKEVVAETIHRKSNRSNGPFLCFNCNSMPQELMESEFFGYEKGAFTGANCQGKPGLLEMAHGGTLLLDEIADLAPDLQGKFLRLLEKREFRRLGGTRNVKVNVRIIAATNRDLLEMVDKGLFRADLYYRLSVVPIYIPSLRERPEDVAALITYYLKRFNDEHGSRKRITVEAVELLQSYHWPGNVRELINMLERLVIVSPQDLIEPGDIPFSMRHLFKQEQLQTPVTALRKSLEQAEKNILVLASQEHESSRKIAKALGCSHTTALRKLKKYKFSQ